MKFVTKKALKIENEQYKKSMEELVKYNDELADKVEELLNMYPFNVDDVVYELILKTDKGRFTRKNPSKEYSCVIATTVTKKNYFMMIEKYEKCLVFKEKQHAEEYLDNLCK